jgi:hypothetical protein
VRRKERDFNPEKDSLPDKVALPARKSGQEEEGRGRKRK